MKYFKDVSGDGGNGDLIRIDIDSDIYDATAADFGDIRILGPANAEIPYAVSLDTANEIRTKDIYNQAKINSLRKFDDNRIELIVEISEKNLRISGISLRTSSRNYEKQLSISGSADMIEWKPICENAAVFDYSELTPISNNTVRFDADGLRFYKITISNISENKQSPRTELITEKRTGNDFSVIEKIVLDREALKINGIDFLTIEKTKAAGKTQTREYPLTAPTIKEYKGKTEIILNSRREPIESFSIKTSSTNFSRQISVYGSDDEKEWRCLGNGKITGIEIAGYREHHLSIPIPRSRLKHYKISVLNGDAPPLSGLAATASGAVFFIEMINRENTNDLKVYYSGSNIPAPSYDIREITDKLKNPSFAQMRFGEEKANPSYRQAGEFSFLNNKPAFITIVLLMVAILSFTLFKNFKKIDSLSTK
jgi:hypothetical protein